MAAATFTVRKARSSDRLTIVHDLAAPLGCPRFSIEATTDGTVIRGQSAGLSPAAVHDVCVELRMACQESLRLASGDIVDEYPDP